jgi:hypothetical protein
MDTQRFLLISCGLAAAIPLVRWLNFYNYRWSGPSETAFTIFACAPLAVLAHHAFLVGRLRAGAVPAHTQLDALVLPALAGAYALGVVLLSSLLWNCHSGWGCGGNGVRGWLAIQYILAVAETAVLVLLALHAQRVVSGSPGADLERAPLLFPDRRQPTEADRGRMPGMPASINDVAVGLAEFVTSRTILNPYSLQVPSTGGRSHSA